MTKTPERSQVIAEMEQLIGAEWCAFCDRRVVEPESKHIESCPLRLLRAALALLRKDDRAHVLCHDLVCNASRSKPRAAEGAGCSCDYRDALKAVENDELKAKLTEAHAEIERLTALLNEPYSIGANTRLLRERAEKAEHSLQHAREENARLREALEECNEDCSVCHGTGVYRTVANPNGAEECDRCERRRKALSTPEAR